ncbi:MAG: site-2 protease family protein [Ruminococcaceae bacterium]|nr:site-2 protease family protein [Oscillospiraceae bacterium]
MLLDLVGGSGDVKTAFISLLLSLPVILLALTVHEFAHGYVAYLCGDSTAKAFGRLSLNPMKHLDPFGALCMLIAGFGWAKPVPVNTRYLRKPKRDMMLVALAGPAANFLLAFLAAAVTALIEALAAKYDMFLIFGNMVYYTDNIGLALYFVYIVFRTMVMLNIGLGLFNLIPLPPLDGSKILAGLLPSHLAMRYVQIERYTRQIFLAVMLLSFTGVLSILLSPLNWARGAIEDVFIGLFEFLFKGIG